jgi:hypothetical protein
MPNKSKKLRISGPGAADFLTAPGGIDFPETDPSKGAAQATRGEAAVRPSWGVGAGSGTARSREGT